MRFRTKLMAGFSLLLLLTCSVFLIFNVGFYRKRLMDDVIKQQTSFARHVLNNIIDMAITGDSIRLSREIIMIQRDMMHMDYIFIIGNGGQLLAHTFDGGFPPELFDVNILPEGETFSSRLLLTGKGRIRDFAMRTARHKHGEVHVGMNEEAFYKNMIYTLKYSILIMIFSVVLGLLLIYAMSHFLVKPLKKLSLGMKRIGNGDLKFRIEEKGDYEILNLIRGYNRMAESIREETNLRKQVDETLRSERDRAGMYLDVAGVILTALNEKGEITLMNKKGCETLGYSEGELNGKNWFDTCLPARLRKEVKEVFRQLIAGNIKPVEHYDNPVLIKSGEERIIHWHNSLLRDEKGMITGTLSSGEDITEQKKTEEALNYERYLLNSLMENIPDSIYFKDNKSRFIRVNRALANRLDISGTSQAIGKTDYDLFKIEHAEPAFKDEMEIIRTGKPIIGKEEKVTFPDGREKWVLTTKMPLKDEKGKIVGTFGVSRDITERKNSEESLRKSEEHLRQAQKMEAVGQLAGGIAHDFNNLLTAIIGYSDILMSDSKLNNKIRNYVQEIKKSGERAASLTQQLLAYSRKQMLQPKVLNLNNLIKNLEKMLHRLISEDIALITEMDPLIGAVKADPNQIEQVIINLVVNARDAMAYGGKITIATKKVDIDEEYCRQHAEIKPGNYSLLSISDTGHGMDEDTTSHIFEPFFTTKEVGKGTGLGLSTVYGIVKQSDGYIYCDSKVNQGTTFDIYFPVIDTVETGKDISLKEDKPEGGSETILVVEDDKMVRDMISASLRQFGYTVLEAQDGEDASRVCKSHGEKKIPLLITDVIMPGINGHVLAEKLVKKYRDMKILFISGYADDMAGPRSVLDEGTPFLQKPFTPKALAQKVRELLND